MGYKLAGYDVVGNCEIDPVTNDIYRKNNNPKLSYTADIRDFAKLENYPDELLHLDILDGSPPCTTFSIAGKREETWGKEKMFTEGQKKQRLDDLFFPFIDLAERLQPRVVIAENVKGMILGAARAYVNEIIRAFDAAGYTTQIFLLNSALAGVPQIRERVFFVAQRKDQHFPKLRLQFNERPVKFGEYREPHGIPPTAPSVRDALSHRTPQDKTLADINLRLYNKNVGFTSHIIHDEQVCNTLTSGGYFTRYCDGTLFTKLDYLHAASFPEDYDPGAKGAQFLCGMSVPPLLMARIAKEIEKQWLSRKG